MSESAEIALRISSLCTGFLNPRYTKGKLRSDPLYDGVFRELESSPFPLLDIGCGLGLLAMYLRERGWGNTVSGFDYDLSKITSGREMLARGGYRDISLSQGDARLDLPEHRGDVTLLDILQFFDAAEQTVLLQAAAARVAPGGQLIVRSCLRENNGRFVTTLLGDMVAKWTFWMKAAPIHYPSDRFFRRILEAEGFAVEIRPLWGKTPFNNHIILARRRG